MSIETYITFLLTSLVVVLVPGPTVMLVVSHAMSTGKRAVVPLSIGAGLGDLAAMTFSFIGLGAVLATSTVLFSVLKLGGAAYLIFLGVKMFRAPVASIREASQIPASSPLRQFTSAFFTTALNPKSITFFVAFLPQFVSHKADLIPQFFVLGVTFLIFGMLNVTAYACFASRLRTLLTKPKALKRFNRIGGSVMLGAGVLTATATHG